MATKQKAAVIGNLYRGGIANSKYSQNPNSVASLIGLDIHSIPGVISVNQKLSKISGTTVTGKITKILPCSDGLIYFFDTDGKIYKYTSSTFSYVATASPAAGSVGILDAYEFEGYIYYAMQSRLGRVAVGSPTDWSTRNDSYKTFTNANSSYHPIQEQNGRLYVGDGNLLAELMDDGTTWTANRLDLPLGYVIKCLSKDNTDVAIGTIVSGSGVKSSMFWWNTWSVSYHAQDEIDEIGINAFIHSDNVTFVQAGINGSIYYISGYKLIPTRKKIPGIYTASAYMNMYANARTVHNGKPIFAISNGANNPCYQGIYSLFQSEKDPTLDYVLNLEYPISERSTGEYVLSGLDISAITSVGNDLYVGWKNGSTYGVDKLDYSAKLEKGILESRIMRIDRHLLNRYGNFQVMYESLPSNTSIVFKHKKNHAGSFSSFTNSSVNDTMRSLVQIEEAMDASTMQIRIELVTDGNNSPIMEDILIIFS